MKDSDGPSSNNDEHVQHACRCASNGDIPMSNGSACRRRTSNGGGGAGRRPCGGDAGCCELNGRLTAPRVDRPPAPAAPPPPAAGPGFAAVEQVAAGGWTVPTRAQILRDVANLCTFTGAILATLAMACMWKGRYV